MELFINVDGGSRGNPGPGASGWVIKDKKGKTLIKEGLFFKLCTNNQAEFTALKMALKAASDYGKCSLNIKADSQLLVRQYLGQYKIKNAELQVLMDEIKKLAANFKQITITHIPREQNKEADAICNLIMDKALNNKVLKPVLNTQTREVQITKTAEPKKLQPAIIKKRTTTKTAAKTKAEKDPIFTKTSAKKKIKKSLKKAPVQLELFDKI